MNLNMLSYGIYILLTLYLILWVGRQCYRNGRVFILRLFRNNEAMTDTTNNILLIAYYLFNIGYAVLQLYFWEQVTTAAAVIESIAGKAGLLIMILAVTHYCNITLIYYLSKKSLLTN